MRFKNSYAAAVAAAVAAVVFSAAFQPAEASIITIDTFTETQVLTASGTDSNVADLISAAGSFGGFTTRDVGGYYEQDSTYGFRTLLASSNGSGLGTIQLTSNAAGSGSVVSAASYLSYTTSSSVDLTGQKYPGFWIQTGATSATPAITSSGPIVGWIEVLTAEAEYVYYGQPGMWAPNTATGILFSTLQAINPALDFTRVKSFTLGISIPNGAAGSTEYNATANFTAISVPEPTHMVFVAGIGAALGAWRLRKLRRSHEAAGDSIAG